MYEQVCYQNSFLKQVIARIDFASPVTQLEKSVPNKLVNTIVKNFPIIEPTEVILQELALEENSLKHSQTMTKQWNYFGKDRGKQLSLSSQNVFVVYTTYNNYEETKEQFGSVIDALAKSFPETKVARFGLRYINQIEVPLTDPTTWGDYVDVRLLGSREFFNENEAITRLLTISELKYDDLGVRLQFGMPNPDYPAVVKRPLFVLDIDASIAQAHDFTEAMDYMDEAHSRIQALFERSITDTLREKMNVQSIQQ